MNEQSNTDTISNYVKTAGTDSIGMGNPCMDCPRECRADRTSGSGFCGGGALPKIARAALHFWEEPCISGTNGSGTVFFSGCSLRCVYCQNRKIVLGDVGTTVSIERLAEIYLELQEQGAHNINLVTPAHETDAVIGSLERAKRQGLRVPIVYNTGSYEKVENLKRLEGLVDVWLPDLKYYSSELSARYSSAPDYFEVARAAIAEMYRQAGKPVFAPLNNEESRQCYVKLTEDIDTLQNEKGHVQQDTGAHARLGADIEADTDEKQADAELQLIKKGVIVRHMVIPTHTVDSKKIIEYLYRTYGDNIFISIMSQYTPVIDAETAKKYPELARKLTEREYDAVVDYAIELGVENAFIQEGDVAEESFIPAFDGTGVVTE